MQIFISKKIFIVLCIILVFIIYFQLKDRRPIKFEKFNKYEFKRVVEQKFPIGSNMDNAVSILVASRVSELNVGKIDKQYIKQFENPNTEYTALAVYHASLFSRSPLSRYEIHFATDKSRKIINVWVSKHNFLEYFWW